jgi:hypothetical protein
MTRLEALLDAISAYNGFKDPDSHAYQARNPLMLKEFERGIYRDRLRRFRSLVHGIQAGIFDLNVKCSGKSNAKIEEHTLQGLMRVYSLPDGTANYVARYLRKALKDNAIKETTELKYFVEKQNGRC